MVVKTRLTLGEQYQRIIHEYQQAHGGQPFTMGDVADWALKTGRLQPHPVDIRRMLARDLSRAALCANVSETPVRVLFSVEGVG